MKLWFKAKTYGYGWYPVSWEGWVTLLIYLLVVVGLGVNLDKSPQAAGDLILFFASIAAATAILIAICVKKGEPARWRWGNGSGPSSKH